MSPVLLQISTILLPAAIDQLALLVQTQAQLANGNVTDEEATEKLRRAQQRYADAREGWDRAVSRL